MWVKKPTKKDMLSVGSPTKNATVISSIHLIAEISLAVAIEELMSCHLEQFYRL